MRLTSDTAAYAAMSHAGNPFGDGTASKQIVGLLAKHFQMQSTALAETV
jgi:UDP-N-acetylglucosamine 2-epimerase